MEAYRYDVDGARVVMSQHMQCGRRQCRVTFAPNFCYTGNAKRNTATVADIGDTLFASSKRAFSTRLLRFYISLCVKGHLAARAFAWSFAEVLCNEADGSAPVGWAG